MAVTMNYGAAPTYVKLATQTLTSAATVTFSNIPQGYTDLRLIVVGGTTRATTSDTIRLQFNSDTSSKYSSNYVLGNGSAASAYAYATQTSQFTDGIRLVGTDFGLRSMIAYDIMNYANTTTYKTTLARCVTPESTVIGSSISVGLWRSTSAITSIYLQGDSVANFAIGTTFTIYGIKAALVPKATGGDIVVQDGTYWYHAFRSTGVFNPKQSLSCDVLVIAGGGGGGYAISGQSTAGGAGAGGLRYFAAESVTTATSVTVGAGGAGAVSGGAIAAGAAGGNSVFASYTSAGGAGGFSADNGGSGSGQRNNAGAGGLGNTPATSPSQGNNGGASTGGVAGGGGGAGAAGGTPNGGIGVNTYSTWATATGTGVSGYYAGGGGGHTTGIGGTGGGANGSTGSSAHAIANTGGGGGASQVSPSGNGGSGLVIVRYPI